MTLVVVGLGSTLALLVLLVPVVAKRRGGHPGEMAEQAWSFAATPVVWLADLLRAIRARVDAWYHHGHQLLLGDAWLPGRLLGAMAALVVWTFAFGAELVLLESMVGALGFKSSQVTPLTIGVLLFTSAAGLILVESLRGRCGLVALPGRGRARTVVVVASATALAGLLTLQALMGAARADQVRFAAIQQAQTLRDNAALVAGDLPALAATERRKADLEVANANQRSGIDHVFSSSAPVVTGLLEAALSWAPFELLLLLVLLVASGLRLPVALVQHAVNLVHRAFEAAYTLHRRLLEPSWRPDASPSSGRSGVPVPSDPGPGRRDPGPDGPPPGAEPDLGVDPSSVRTPPTTEALPVDPRWSGFRLDQP